MASVSVPVRAATSVAPDVSLIHLYLLRAAYLLLVTGLGIFVWPAVIEHAAWAPSLSPWYGIGDSLLAGLSLLALLGLRYPLKMLPLLLFEMTWKAVWLLCVALPANSGHAQPAADLGPTIQACVMVVVFPLLIPWRYVYATFVRAPGDRWQ